MFKHIKTVMEELADAADKNSQEAGFAHKSCRTGKQVEAQEESVAFAVIREYMTKHGQTLQIRGTLKEFGVTVN